MSAGTAAPAAFASAVQALGQVQQLQAEFAKSMENGERRWPRFARANCYVAAGVVLLVNMWMLLEFNLSSWQRVVGASVLAATVGYLVALPFVLGWLTKVAYVSFMRAFKLAGGVVILLPLVLLLPALGVTRWPMGDLL